MCNLDNLWNIFQSNVVPLLIVLKLKLIHVLAVMKTLALKNSDKGAQTYLFIST